MPGIYDSLIEAMMPKVPSNTPKTGAATPVTAPHTANAGVSRRSSGAGVLDRRVVSDSVERSLKSALGNTLMAAKSNPETDEQTATVMLKPTRISSVKSRKENMQESTLGPEPSAAVNESAVRAVSQTFATTNTAGTKRPRVVTPAAAKVIDDEDEPRSSPSIRKASRNSVKQDGERVILGEIEN